MVEYCMGINNIEIHIHVWLLTEHYLQFEIYIDQVSRCPRCQLEKNLLLLFLRMDSMIPCFDSIRSYLSYNSCSLFRSEELRSLLFHLCDPCYVQAYLDWPSKSKINLQRYHLVLRRRNLKFMWLTRMISYICMCACSIYLNNQGIFINSILTLPTEENLCGVRRNQSKAALNIHLKISFFFCDSFWISNII